MRTTKKNEEFYKTRIQKFQKSERWQFRTIKIKHYKNKLLKYKISDQRKETITNLSSTSVIKFMKI